MSHSINILNHNYSQITPVNIDVLKLLSTEQKIYRGKKLGWKTLTHQMIDPPTGIFKTGLVPFLVSNLKDVVLENDSRDWPDDFTFHLPELNTVLRDYQIDYLIEALKLRRCIVESETGSGKTTMMAAILASLKLPTLILVPNKTLLQQLLKELGSLLPNQEFGQASGDGVDLKETTIGLSSTLIKFSAGELRQFKVLMMDEVHTAAGNQNMNVILTASTPFRFGFTGTATGRSDGRDMEVEGLFGPPFKLIESKELTEKGFLAPVHIEIVRGWWEGKFSDLEDHLIVYNKKRNQLIADIVRAQKGTVLVLIKRVEHGRILQEMIPNSIFVSGETDGEERESVRQSVKGGKFRVLIASNVFSTGLDIPNLEVGVNAAGGKAEILTKQRFGRIVRPWHEVIKKWIDIWDDYHPKLEGHSKERLKYYKEKTQHVTFVGFTPGKQERLEDGRDDSPSSIDVDME